MPKDLTRENAVLGTVVFSWDVKEYDQYDRSLGWYFVMTFIAAALITYSIITANYLFALVIVLFGIVLYLHEMQAPLRVQFALTTTGMVLGRKFYRYTELKNFWIVYQPGQVKNLYFTISGLFRHRLQIPLMDSDPLAIRQHLIKFVTENPDEEEEPVTDHLARVLKLH